MQTINHSLIIANNVFFDTVNGYYGTYLISTPCCQYGASEHSLYRSWHGYEWSENGYRDQHCSDVDYKGRDCDLPRNLHQHLDNFAGMRDDSSERMWDACPEHPVLVVDDYE